jgi:hypothetical protein
MLAAHAFFSSAIFLSLGQRRISLRTPSGLVSFPQRTP